MSQNGKGDKPRPPSTTKKKYNKNWEKTFRKKKPVKPIKDEEKNE